MQVSLIRENNHVFFGFGANVGVIKINIDFSVYFRSHGGLHGIGNNREKYAASKGKENHID